MLARTISKSWFGTTSERQSHSSSVQGERKSTFSAAVTKRRCSTFMAVQIRIFCAMPFVHSPAEHSAGVSFGLGLTPPDEGRGMNGRGMNRMALFLPSFRLAERLRRGRFQFLE